MQSGVAGGGGGILCITAACERTGRVFLFFSCCCLPFPISLCFMTWTIQATPKRARRTWELAYRTACKRCSPQGFLCTVALGSSAARLLLIKLQSSELEAATSPISTQVHVSPCKPLSGVGPGGQMDRRPTQQAPCQRAMDVPSSCRALDG